MGERQSESGLADDCNSGYRVPYTALVAGERVHSRGHVGHPDHSRRQVASGKAAGPMCGERVASRSFKRRTSLVSLRQHWCRHSLY